VPGELSKILAAAGAALQENQMLYFNIKQRSVVLEYEPTNETSWVVRELKTHHRIRVRQAFIFRDRDLISGPEEDEFGDIEEGVFKFRFARRTNGYFHIAGRILDIENDVLIADEGVPLERKTFVAERNIGIFKRIAKVKQDGGDIIVGGDRDGAIPLDAFRELLDRFPNTGELNRYAAARVEAIVGEFFDGVSDARKKYETYLSKRKSSVSKKPLRQESLLQAEIDKYVYLRDTITAWLEKAESYSERDWQEMITKVILLLLPKYVAVLENVQISDFYSSPDKTKKRFIDLCLVDAGGNIDVIEIKKPFDNSVLAKTRYRDNNLPTRELSGSIMQAEKYLFHLSKWGVEGERQLTKRHAKRLPNGMQLRITNPKAIIILGRDCSTKHSEALTADQMFDLEVIKRKYANMMDILTYDDLLRRLNNTIASLTDRKAEIE